MKRAVQVMEAVAAIATVVFAVMLFANEPSDDGAAAGGANADGAALYRENCASCHGSEGEGNIGPQLNDGRVVELYPNIDDHVARVEAGGGGMPSFEGELNDDEIRAVVEYERTGLP